MILREFQNSVMQIGQSTGLFGRFARFGNLRRYLRNCESDVLSGLAHPNQGYETLFAGGFRGRRNRDSLLRDIPRQVHVWQRVSVHLLRQGMTFGDSCSIINPVNMMEDSCGNVSNAPVLKGIID